MIELAVTLISLSVGGLILILYYSYNGTYKKFQKVLVPQHFADTPEVQDTITLTVEKGRIPTWLTGGVMYRIGRMESVSSYIYIYISKPSCFAGPGRFNIKENDGSIYVIRHAFDGLPFLHRFEVNGQTQILKYNSRLLAKGLESKIKNKTFKGGLFFGHMPQLTFYEWLVDFYSRLANLVLFPKPVDESAPDEQAVGVTATPNFPLPPNMAKNDNEKVLVSKTDANILQKIHAETLGKLINHAYIRKTKKNELSLRTPTYL
jgi:torulene dioxygenase